MAELERVYTVSLSPTLKKAADAEAKRECTHFSHIVKCALIGLLKARKLRRELEEADHG